MYLFYMSDNFSQKVIGLIDKGGSVLDIYDALHAKTDQIKHVLVRHEQAATHMADGYARATGKPGVVLVCSGPGATSGPLAPRPRGPARRGPRRSSRRGRSCQTGRRAGRAVDHRLDAGAPGAAARRHRGVYRGAGGSGTTRRRIAEGSVCRRGGRSACGRAVCPWAGIVACWPDGARCQDCPHQRPACAGDCRAGLDQ